MMNEIGKNIWVFPDAYLPAKGQPYQTSRGGNHFSHESLCMINLYEKDALVKISFYYEDNDPYENYEHKVEAKRSLHLRLDKLVLPNYGNLKSEVPYSIVVKSNIKIVAQLSRLDTTSNYNSFMTSLGWGTNV
jgi:hypothetical protein